MEHCSFIYFLSLKQDKVIKIKKLSKGKDFDLKAISNNKKNLWNKKLKINRTRIGELSMQVD